MVDVTRTPFTPTFYRGPNLFGMPIRIDAFGNLVSDAPDQIMNRPTTVGERAQDFLAAYGGIPRTSSRRFFGGNTLGSQADPLARFSESVGVGNMLPLTSTAIGAAKVANSEPEGLIDVALAPLDYFGLRAAYKGARQAPELVELTQSPQTREYFQSMLTRAQDSQGPIGKQVDVYDADDYEGMTMIASPNADAGFAITPEGEIVSLVKNKDSKMRGFASKALAEAAPNGGVFLNAFDTYLTDLYGKAGFRPVSRIPFDEDVMRDAIGDDAAEAFMESVADFNDGAPDLVFMVKDPDYKMYERGSGELMEGYDDARESLDPFIESQQQLLEEDILRRLRALIPGRS